MVITIHQFIKDTKVKPSDKYMILGTIHPHNVDEFKLNYFYGNKNSLWSILNDAFPNLKLKRPGSDTFLVKDIKRVLKQHNVFITDCIRKCSRKIKVNKLGIEKISAADKDLEVIEDNKTQIEEALKNSQINTIFFTSGSGKNNAYDLFRHMFMIKPRFLNLNKNTKELSIPKEYFGREIRGVILLSPSGGGNRGISSSKAYKQKKKEYGSGHHISKYRIDFYKNKFKKVFG